MSDTMNDKEILANQYPSNSKIRPAKSPDSTPEDNRQKKVVTGLVKNTKSVRSVKKLRKPFSKTTQRASEVIFYTTLLSPRQKH